MAKQKQLAEDNQQQPEAVVHQAPVGGLGFGQPLTRRRPRELKMIQKINADPANGLVPGVLYDALTNTIFESMQGVFLDISLKRDYFEDTVNFTKDSRPLCKSVNGLVPLQATERNPNLVPQAPTCKVCPKGQWTDFNPATRKSKPPLCPPYYRITFIDGHTELPYVINAKGTSVKYVDRLNLVLDDLCRLSKLKDKIVLNLYDFTAELKPTQEGTAFVLKYLKPQRVQNPGAFGPFYEEYILAVNQDIHQEEEAAQTEQALEREFAEV